MVNKAQINGIGYHNEDQQRMAKLPMDWAHLSKELSSTSYRVTVRPTTCTVAADYQNNDHAVEVFDDSSTSIGRAQLSNVRAIDDIFVGTP